MIHLLFWWETKTIWKPNVKSQGNNDHYIIFINNHLLIIMYRAEGKELAESWGVPFLEVINFNNKNHKIVIN